MRRNSTSYPPFDCVVAPASHIRQTARTVVDSVCARSYAIHACLLAFILAMVCTVSVTAAEHPWEGKRIYYVIEFMGQLIEKGHFVRKPGSYEKIDCWVIEEEKSFYANGNPKTPIRTIKVRTYSTFDGLALQRYETILEGAQGSEKITIERGDARFDSDGVYGGAARVAVPDDVLFEVTGEWLAGCKLKGGSRYSANVLDRASRGVLVSDVSILEEEVESGPETPSVWLAEIFTPGRQPVTARYTADGRLLRLEGGGMIYQVVPRQNYELGRIPGTGRSVHPGDSLAGALESGAKNAAGGAATAAIPIGMGVPAWDNFGWLRLRAEPANEWNKVLRNSEYSLIQSPGGWAEITAMSNAPYIDSDVEFPMNIPPDIQRYLSPTSFIPSDHEAIIEAAYVAVADIDSRREERNVLRAVSYLAGWINQSVGVDAWRGYESGALETLAVRSGDSLGHARLFAAMARTLGIPTRVCQGFLAYVNRAVNHCWAEAWINGAWVPVDTTVSRVGFPAGYVLIEYSDSTGEFKGDFADFMRNPILRLSMVSAGRETPRGRNVELVLGNRRTYAVTEEDWLANLYWGFALRLPRGWRGEARLNSVEIRSGDNRARVKCEALEGDFEAGDSELNGTVATLRTNLNQFRLLDSRVITFDDEGATLALYVDFTCIEGQVSLRCRQYIIPRRHRAFRISFWSPADQFRYYEDEFERILSTFEF